MALSSIKCIPSHISLVPLTSINDSGKDSKNTIKGDGRPSCCLFIGAQESNVPALKSTGFKCAHGHLGVSRAGLQESDKLSEIV